MDPETTSIATPAPESPAPVVDPGATSPEPVADAPVTVTPDVPPAASSAEREPLVSDPVVPTGEGEPGPTTPDAPPAPEGDPVPTPTVNLDDLRNLIPENLRGDGDELYRDPSGTVYKTLPELVAGNWATRQWGQQRDTAAKAFEKEATTLREQLAASKSEAENAAAVLTAWAEANGTEAPDLAAALKERFRDPQYRGKTEADFDGDPEALRAFIRDDVQAADKADRAASDRTAQAEAEVTRQREAEERASAWGEQNLTPTFFGASGDVEEAALGSLLETPITEGLKHGNVIYALAAQDPSGEAPKAYAFGLKVLFHERMGRAVPLPPAVVPAVPPQAETAPATPTATPPPAASPQVETVPPVEVTTRAPAPPAAAPANLSPDERWRIALEKADQQTARK